MASQPKHQRRPSVTGANLRRLRLAAGLTQAQLSERSGVHQTTIADLERGAMSGARDATLERLAGALGVRKGDLVEPEVEATPMEPLLREFLGSPWAATLKPPVTEEELTWLRGLPGIVWISCPPTPEALRYFVEGYRARARKQSKEG